MCAVKSTLTHICVLSIVHISLMYTYVRCQEYTHTHMCAVESTHITHVRICVLSRVHSHMHIYVCMYVCMCECAVKSAC